MTRFLALIVMAGTLLSVTPSVVSAQFGVYVGPRHRSLYRPHYYGGPRPYYTYHRGYYAPRPYHYTWYGPRPYWGARPWRF